MTVDNRGNPGKVVQVTDRDGDVLLVETRGAVRILRINRPKQLGAFNWEMIDRWADALAAAREDPQVRVVLLTGTGRGFCAGVDLAEFTTAGEAPIDRKRMLTDRVHKVARAVEELDKPLICAVNGLAVGAGMDMALMCDIRLAAESATFCEGYITIGLVPGDGGSYFLPRLVGTARALELLWTGQTVTAGEALAMGIVSHVHPDEELFDRAMGLAERIAGQSPIAVSMIKRSVYQSLRLDLRTSLDLISSHMGIVQSTLDQAEAMRAFRERRKPTFFDR
jgi:enoyl-CoA hydratase/carnithine racemase